MFLFYRAVVCFLLITLPAAAQAQAFEKITIKPARSADPRNRRVQVLPNGDLIAHSVPVIRLLSYAYGVPSNPSPRLNALPGWTVGDSYDIEAKDPGQHHRREFSGRRGTSPPSTNGPPIARRSFQPRDACRA